MENMIINYIKCGSVEIINYRGKENVKLELMNDCYKKIYNKYDWLFFFDIDEFLFLKKYTNIKSYLNNRSLFERFTESEKKVAYNLSRKAGIKTIIKGHLKYIKKVDCQHRISMKLKTCDGFGNIVSLKNIITNKADYENYYINHFYSKSTEEFINKINKGDIMFGHNSEWNLAKVRVYFGLNKITLEKIDLIEKYSKLNLSKFKLKIKYPKNISSNITEARIMNQKKEL